MFHVVFVKTQMKHCKTTLPFYMFLEEMAPIIPIGVFWDIENCQVPKGKSALSIAQCIRDKFFGIHTEAEFMCVCDISKESRDVIEELNSAQVSLNIRYSLVVSMSAYHEVGHGFASQLGQTKDHHRGLFNIYNRWQNPENSRLYWPVDSICTYWHTWEQPAKLL